MGKAAQWMLMLLLGGCAGQPPLAPHAPQPTQSTDSQVNIDPLTRAKIDAILALRNSQPSLNDGQRIALISQQFLDTPYLADRLIGSASNVERLTIDFRALDCFTLLDYVEALRNAEDYPQFIHQLTTARYVNGEIGFLTRKHFFSDWSQPPHASAKDISAQLSPQAVTLHKTLNHKADGGQYLPGLPNVTRAISYIPSGYVDDHLLSQLRTGDYIGIYSNLPGLDVSHVGIYVMTPSGPVLRNASSREHNRRVVDSPFIDYVIATPGIVVLRPL
ncbi:DUF1460 domain-containing protein [Serratia odorifera]|uniref:DUF1460 domain-containing protein n=2 Tax=Serratia odorifera TaxID=618 RepID=D4E9B4_SEROD|nr:DUF1460 domain-containing protein [Serratia odorifera]EFE93880.1 hypothetical protein HMPREF0758_4764 [Serratia odorifera DSM 4582]PNK88525.1 DUF1460 domain-containing protein [Serratia odorifera]RII69680.1 DUF1460 domain-containing protein [Serratia odorifera]VDZ65621.1 Protein of uncharacterised function (DUF1460) [Serratia odorifera]